MLSIRQNLLETIHGGKPDRFVNQYEYLELIVDPITIAFGDDVDLGCERTNEWGVKIHFPKGTPGPFPACEGEDKLIKDISQWHSILSKARTPESFSDEDWAPSIAQANNVDRKEKFVATFFYPGIFEKLHYFMGMEDAMMGFYEEPEIMHELIDWLTDWEIRCASEIIRHIHPDALFHHDDWGSQHSSFISPKMFEEFILPSYKKIYSYWKSNGVELIVHHSDSYAANLVPYMIESGIDIWQGAVLENDIPSILKEYGGKISIHAGLDNGKFDTPDWSIEKIRAGLEKIIQETDGKYIIPGFTMGGPSSVFEGAYDAASTIIADLSRQHFLQ